MPKRYPHTAIITLDTGSKIINGEYAEGNRSTITITGRYEPVDLRMETIKSNVLGDEKRVKGVFYTSVKSPVDAEPIRIKIGELGIDVDIISWDSFQTHSVISL